MVPEFVLNILNQVILHLYMSFTDTMFSEKKYHGFFCVCVVVELLYCN